VADIDVDTVVTIVVVEEDDKEKDQISIFTNGFLSMGKIHV